MGYLVIAMDVLALLIFGVAFLFSYDQDDNT